MSALLQKAFFALVVRPVLMIFSGGSVHGKELLPSKGPAIIIANHNSHLDTLTIMAMYPLKMLPLLRPVAAADYFMRTRVLAWFATNVIGIIPIARRGGQKAQNPLEGCFAALDRGEILILFPEGSRGEPEMLAQFKKGIAHLVKARPDTPVHPMFMHGLGKVLPKDGRLLVPFNSEIVVGAPLVWNDGIDAFMAALQARMQELAATVHATPWH